MPRIRKPVATVDAGDLSLSPGETGRPLAEAQGETGPRSVDSFDSMMTVMSSEVSGSPHSTGLSIEFLAPVCISG